MAAQDPAQKPMRPALTRELVIQAAIRMADESGLAALSMRKLAKSLGVEAMSLYHHVSNKSELIGGMTDAVVGKIQCPELGPGWQAAMRQRANSAHQVLGEHPWATHLIVSCGSIGPALLRYTNATVGCLVEAGFSYELADRAWNAIDSHIYGFILQEQNFPFQPEDYAETASAHLHLIPVDRFPYMHELASQVIAGTHHGIQDFNFGLDLILAGLEQRLAGQ
jgi:AcrR family transcriptional regulator